MVLKLVVNNQIQLLDWTNVARINIEDKLLMDNRFSKLVIKLGSKRTAIGACYEAFRVAQDYWFPNRYPIPKATWKKLELMDELIEVGLAYEDGDGVYVCGAEDQFRWLFGAQKAGAASARVKNDQKNANVEIIEEKVQPPLTAVNRRQAMSTSSSSSSSCSRSSRNTNSCRIAADDPIEASASQSTDVDACEALNSFGEAADCHSSDSERESSSGRDQPTSLSSDSSEASSCKQPPQSTPPIGRRPPAAVITPDDLFNLWNELVKGVFPVVEKRTEERSKKARAVIKAMTADIKDREQALDVFRQIIKYYLGNKFYTGTNERGWVMDISHLLKPQKAIEAWERLNATKRQRPKITIHDSSHWGGLSQGETNLPESTDGISNSSMEDF